MFKNYKINKMVLWFVIQFVIVLGFVISFVISENLIGWQGYIIPIPIEVLLAIVVNKSLDNY